MGQALILVTGSRNWIDRRHMWEELDAWADRHPDDQLFLMEGGANGADSHARAWRKKRGFQGIRMDAPWAIGKPAGPIRNSSMVKIAAALCDVGWSVEAKAFPLPGSSGTPDCIKKLERAGIPVKTIEPREK